jgi:hypothetical protein
MVPSTKTVAGLSRSLLGGAIQHTGYAILADVFAKLLQIGDTELRVAGHFTEAKRVDDVLAGASFSPPPPRHGRMAKARAGKPRPFLTLGQVTTTSAPVAGTLSRLAITMRMYHVGRKLIMS